MVTSSTPLLVIGAILLAWSVVASFFPRMMSVIPAFLGMIVLWLGDCIILSTSTILFWGAATAIVVVNHFLLPRGIRASRSGLGYFAGGALVGLALGLTLYDKASLIGGAFLGAFLGALAFSRTAAGRPMHFPSSKFFNYLGAKGIPPVVTLSMVGISLSALIAGHAIFG